ncbi:hypothetical protein [Maritimibacter fusiformis]|uniref:Uncharacterized protein n=1 Tax=Maritimibacter fusiformis TaxID=2603819 RepID=A0A5D0RM63_9RHOB|nr:hypothetical protein [Maritimibacter fusiformis]TYB81634.1 hypothetical protein FVF75_07925 [Maritimibacter fusiformis]
MRRAALALAAGAVPTAAWAHAFSTGKDAYGAFLEGAGVILAAPGLILPVAALGIALALWRSEGLLAAWLPFLAGGMAGVALAPFAGSWAGLAVIGTGLVVAVIAALVPPARIGPAMPGLAGLTGGAVALAALEGHGWGEVALATRVGILFAANIALATVAGAARVSLERIVHPATRIAWRIAASWVAAILVLSLAFLMRAPGA